MHGSQVQMTLAHQGTYMIVPDHLPASLLRPAVGRLRLLLLRGRLWRESWEAAALRHAVAVGLLRVRLEAAQLQHAWPSTCGWPHEQHSIPQSSEASTRRMCRRQLLQTQFQ